MSVLNYFHANLEFNHSQDEMDNMEISKHNSIEGI